MSKLQLPRINFLSVAAFKIIFGRIVSKLISYLNNNNDKGVRRTVSATPGWFNLI